MRPVIRPYSSLSADQGDHDVSEALRVAAAAAATRATRTFRACLGRQRGARAREWPLVAGWPIAAGVIEKAVRHIVVGQRRRPLGAWPEPKPF